MIDLIVEPFQYGFMLRALFISGMIGIICPVLGSYVVIRGMGFMGDAMAHSVLPGIVIALLAGVSPFLGSVPMSILVAVTVGYLIRSKAVTEDTAFGVLFATLITLVIVPSAYLLLDNIVNRKKAHNAHIILVNSNLYL